MLSAKDIESGKILIPQDCRRISIEDYNSIFKNYNLKINDILLTIVGTIGRVAMVDNLTNKYALQRSVAIIRVNSLNHPLFIFYLLQTNNIKKQYYSKMNQSAQGGIYLDSLNKLSFKNTILSEQEKIAKFLSIVDKRIKKQRQLVESLKKYKRGLLSAIFEQKHRFKDDNGNDYPEWRKIPLGSIFVERVEKAIGNEELLSVTINEGIKKRNTIDIKDNSSEDKSHYKKVYKDDIAYNTMRMWQGASGVSKYNGMVSPAYTVISPKIDVNIDFWSYYLKYYKIIHLFQKFSQGLTSDTWNLKFPQFAEIKVFVPSKVEQGKLAEMLLTLDTSINIHQNYLEKQEQIKKSLLQQMFI